MPFLSRFRSPSQLHEFYLSCSLRSLAGSLFGVYTLFYLWESGFSLPALIVYQTLFAGLRIPLNFATAYVISWLGPKHAITISNVIHVLFMLLLLNISPSTWLLLPLVLLATTAGSLYWLSYRVFLSKVTQSTQSGHQVGWIYSFESAAELIGILVGGLLAHFFDPKVTIITAVSVLIISMLPFLLSAEPTIRHQRPNYTGIWSKIKTRRRNLVAAAGSRLSYVANSSYWTLYIAITIFASNTYGIIGVLTAISLLLSFFAAIFIGRWADKGKSYLLLRWGVAGEIALALAQMVISTPLGAIAHRLVKEKIDRLHVIPINKGIVDEANHFEPQRIEYIVIIEGVIMFAQAMLGLITLILMQATGHLTGLKLGVILAGFASLLIFAQNFRTLSFRANTAKKGRFI